MWTWVICSPYKNKNTYASRIGVIEKLDFTYRQNNAVHNEKVKQNRYISNIIINCINMMVESSNPGYFSWINECWIRHCFTKSFTIGNDLNYLKALPKLYRMKSWKFMLHHMSW